MLFSELVDITGGEIVQQKEDILIDKFTIDSRKAIGSEVFIAIAGLNNNGHDFIQDAFDKGVRHFITEQKVSPMPDASMLLVKSSILALQRIATAHRKAFDFPVIGITGSNGKTTVKEWLSPLLTGKYRVIKSPKSYNSQVGVPLSVLEMGDYDFGVFEAGISQTGEMTRLAEIIQPTIGIFTNIGEAHSDGFESIDQKMEEKCRLFGFSEKIICCADQHPLYQMLKKRFGDKLISWSLQGAEADFQFSESENGIALTGHDLILKLPFSNHQQIENALHAVTTALVVGLENGLIQNAVLKFQPIPMRLELKRAVNNCNLIDDSYNNDLLGLEVALDFMNEQNPNQTKTVILSDLLQSALPDKELYARVQQLLNAKKVNRVITIGERIRGMSSEEYISTKDFLKEPPSFEKETILIKGVRDFGFERIVQHLQSQSHGTVLEINFEALRNNLNTYRALLKPETKIMVMVKAFAYGAGLSEVASFLQHEKVDYLGVAYVDEAVELRKNGINLPIMIMNPEETNFGYFDQHDLQAEIFSIEILRRFIESRSQASIHIKLESGMNRLGFSDEDLEKLLELLKTHREVKVEGIFTHFSSSDDPEEDAYTHDQATRFDQMYKRVTDVLGYEPIRHAVNTPGIIRFPEYHFDMVRLGIGLYGFDPTSSQKLEAVGTLKTHISQINKLKIGETIGYSRKGKVEKDMEIAILPIGYADGYLRVFGNGQGYVSVNGKFAPTTGNICMDMIMVDVTGLDVTEGDEVIIFGENPTIQQLADWSNTIPYEVLTNISQRVKRVYVSE